MPTPRKMLCVSGSCARLNNKGIRGYFLCLPLSMTKHARILFLLLSLFCTVTGRSQDYVLDNLMSKRLLTNDDASYNAVLHIPRLHQENSRDTINALMNFYVRNFGMGATITPYYIIERIREHRFKEQLPSDKDTTEHVSDIGYYEDYIISYYLTWYADNYDIADNKTYAEYYRVAYGHYFEFIKTLATETLKQPGLSAAEKYLLRFFANPDKAPFSELNNQSYNGTSLKRAWLRYNNQRSNISGFDLALMTGIWSPTGSLSRLGNHPYIGYQVGGKFNKWLVDLKLDFRFLHAAEYYTVIISGSPHLGNYFFGLNMGIDAGYELLQRRKFGLEAVGGVAYEGFDAISSTNNNSNNDGSLSTVNLNLGVNLRWYIRHKVKSKGESWSYLALQPKYNFLFYHNDGGSDLAGNAFTLSLIYGGFSRKIDHYYLKGQ
jgi:hypothetical protein